MAFRPPDPKSVWYVLLEIAQQIELALGRLQVQASPGVRVTVSPGEEC
jgi:hypothetical protein